MSTDESLQGDIERWSGTLQDGSFEDLVTALEETVRTLEIGRLPLDTTVTVYELGTKIAQRCEQLLEHAELRVTQIDATVSTEALEELANEATEREQGEADEEDTDEFPF